MQSGTEEVADATLGDFGHAWLRRPGGPLGRRTCAGRSRPSAGPSPPWDRPGPRRTSRTTTSCSRRAARSSTPRSSWACSPNWATTRSNTSSATARPSPRDPGQLLSTGTGGTGVPTPGRSSRRCRAMPRTTRRPSGTTRTGAASSGCAPVPSAASARKRLGSRAGPVFVLLWNSSPMALPSAKSVRHTRHLPGQ